MYAKYDFRKKPSSKEDEDKQPLYPRIVSNGTIDFQRIVKEIAQASCKCIIDRKLQMEQV